MKTSLIILQITGSLILIFGIFEDSVPLSILGSTMIIQAALFTKTDKNEKENR